jgi:methionine-rich copper-binding protein CopC
MRRTRSLTAALAAMLLAAAPATALAHAELVSSRPAADSVLDTAPGEVVVSFDSELDPDTSSLQVLATDGTLIGEGGVDLDVAHRNVLRVSVSLPGDGEYRVTWAAGSIDGHVESGAFAFRIGAAPTMGVANTALPIPSPDLAAIGAVLLLLGAAVAIGLGVRGRRRSAR